MEKIKVILNGESNTLDVWFDDAEKEFISEETGGKVMLKKDKDNRIIWFEKPQPYHLRLKSGASVGLEIERCGHYPNL